MFIKSKILIVDDHEVNVEVDRQDILSSLQDVMAKRKARIQEAFTLIELMMVVAIVGILAAAHLIYLIPKDGI